MNTLIAEAIRVGQKAVEEEERSDQGIKDSGVRCVIPACQGSIHEERERRYVGDPSQMIIGPGAKNQMTLFVTLFCSQCGIQYRQLPNK